MNDREAIRAALDLLKYFHIEKQEHAIAILKTQLSQPSLEDLISVCSRNYMGLYD